MVFRNPFHSRLQNRIENVLADTDSDSSSDKHGEVHPLNESRKTFALPNDFQLATQRRNTIERDFQELKSKATREQTHSIFTNLAAIQRSLPTHILPQKRTSNAQIQISRDESSFNEVMNKENEPKKRSNNETSLSQQRPLEPIDMNARKTQDGDIGIKNQCYNSRARARKERMEKRKEKHKEQSR
jgi:hypothetical protein